MHRGLRACVLDVGLHCARLGFLGWEGVGANGTGETVYLYSCMLL